MKIRLDMDSKSVGDRFRGRANRLVKKARELETITGEVVTSFKIIAPPGKNYKNVPEHVSRSTPDADADAPAECMDIDFEKGSSTPGPSGSASRSPSTPLGTPSKRLGGNKNTPSSSNRHQDRDRCKRCNILFQSDADKQMRSLWMQCTHSDSCRWWVHARCEGLFFRNDDGGNRELRQWLRERRYYCPRHMPPNVYKSDSESSDDDVDDDDETPRRPLKLTAREARAKKGGRGKEPAKRKRNPKK